MLKLADTMNLKLQAEVLALSGCKTAGGKATVEEGFQGLVRAFLFAGAENVIASAWKVPDKENRRSPAPGLQVAAEGGGVPRGGAEAGEGA